MTELELYKYITDNDIDHAYNGDEVVIWLYHWQIEDFCAFIGSYVLSEGGIEVMLQENYIALSINGICEHFNIDIKNVFKNEEYD